MQNVYLAEEELNLERITEHSDSTLRHHCALAPAPGSNFRRDRAGLT